MESKAKILNRLRIIAHSLAFVPSFFQIRPNSPPLSCWI
jgi:hypothetical protein